MKLNAFKLGDMMSALGKAALGGMRKRSFIPLATCAGEISLGVYADSQDNITFIGAMLAVDGAGNVLLASHRDADGDFEVINSEVPNGGRKILARIDFREDKTRPLAEGERMTSLRVRFTPRGRVLYSLETDDGKEFVGASPNFVCDKDESVFKAIDRLVLNLGGVMTPPETPANTGLSLDRNVGPEVLKDQPAQAALVTQPPPQYHQPTAAGGIPDDALDYQG